MQSFSYENWFYSHGGGGGGGGGEQAFTSYHLNRVILSVKLKNLLLSTEALECFKTISTEKKGKYTHKYGV